MIDPPPDDQSPAPARQPGERRLAHPPSDRYRVAVPETPGNEAVGSVAKGAAIALVSAAIGALAIVVLGGVLAVSAGLIVVAAATGWAIGLGLRVGARETLSSGRRSRVALALAVGSVVVGQLGLWLYALTEGGVLGPIDYLGEVFGLLVPLEVVVAAVIGWLSAR